MTRRVVSLGFVLVAAAFLSGAQTVTPPDAGPQQLRLTLATGKRVQTLYESLVLSYTIANPTGAVIRSNATMSYTSACLQISITSGGKVVPFHTGPYAESIGTHETTHEARAVMTGDVVIFFNNATEGLAFPRTGRYSINAKMCVGPPVEEPLMIESGPVEIEVQEPSWADRKFIDALGSEAELVDLLRRGTGSFCMGKGRGECLDRLSVLVDTYPQSAYAPEIARSLAITHAFQGRKSHSEYSIAIDQLTDFLQRWPNHPLSADVSYDLIVTLDEAGRSQRAIDTMDRFESDYPDRVHMITQLHRKIRPVEPEPEPTPALPDKSTQSDSDQ